MKTEDLIAEAISLPIEIRAHMVDTLLKSLPSPEDEVDQKWIAVAQERLKSIRLGKTETIPGDEVFANILKS